MTDASYDDDWGLRPRRGGALRRWIGLILGLLVLGVIVAVLLNGPAIEESGHDHKVIRVALPPPPPAPPPPPQVKPPEPKPLPKEVEQPQPQPVPQPAPPTPQATAQSTDALTARAGPGPSNYNLARGDGGGTHIGGAPGNGVAFAAYAQATLDETRRTVQNDPALTKEHYLVRLSITVDADGRITAVGVAKSSGDAHRDAEIQRLLTGRKLPSPPPAGTPMPIRFELNT